VSGFLESEACLCRSGVRHGLCHGGREPVSRPGAPILIVDDENQIFVSPARSVEARLQASYSPCAPGPGIIGG
jgi:hypothetical protein